MTLLKLLGNNGFISYNKDIARNVGVNEAIVLGELCSLADMFAYEEFYFSQEKICNDTGLSEKQVREAIKKLAAIGFVTVTKKGQPCKNWYYLHDENILKFLMQFSKKSETSDCQSGKNVSSSSAEMAELDTPKVPNKNGRNGGTRTAKREALLNNNTQVIIHNNNTNNSPVGFVPSQQIENTNSNSHSDKSVSKAKKQDSFSNEQYTQIFNAYLANWKILYEKQLVQVERPVISKYIKQTIKSCFIAYGFENVLKAVQESINHKWLIDQQYPLNFILGKNEIVMLINKTYSNPPGYIKLGQTMKNIKRNDGPQLCRACGKGYVNYETQSCSNPDCVLNTGI